LNIGQSGYLELRSTRRMGPGKGRYYWDPSVPSQGRPGVRGG
jgi:hypothetical protein